MTTYLHDLLKKDEPIEIMYRCNAPYDDEEDMLYGYCYWTGSALKSDDGDTYYLNDIIEAYKYSDDKLIVWIRVEWSSKNV